MRLLNSAVLVLSSAASMVAALGQEKIISFDSGILQLAGGSVENGQILVSSDEYWGVIRAAGDLAADFGRVTGRNLTLSNGESGSSPASYEYDPVNNMNNTFAGSSPSPQYTTLAPESFPGPQYSDPTPESTLIIVGTIGSSSIIDALIEDDKIDVTEIDGKWESFVSTVVKHPIEGCSKALVIAGSDPRGTIFGIYDISEQIGVSPWYFWADVPTKTQKNLYVCKKSKVQGEPTVKYRGFFLNDEQPALTNWVANNWEDTPYGAGYAPAFYSLVFEVLLRLRANYLWPSLWGTMFEVDDSGNQPLADAYEIVLGTSHTEPLMRAQNEFGNFYEGDWSYNTNNETIDEYFRYGVQRAKPYARNSLWTMAMRGTGDTAIAGLGIEQIVTMLETLIDNQRDIIQEGLGLDDVSEAPQMWCLYKEVQAYATEGLEVPEDVTLLWADDNWGNIRRMPLKNESDRSGGAGVYYHFDYVGDTRDYKWINTIQLEKTAEQMQLAYSRGSDRIWIVNVGDLKPLELPISHFLDMAYDAEQFGIDDVQTWLTMWATREFGEGNAEEIADIMTKFGMYAARRKFELVEPQVYSVLNYNEAEAILVQWASLREQAQALHDSLDGAYQPAFYQIILHPILGGETLYKIQIGGAMNNLYGWQKRNAANDVIDSLLGWMNDDNEWTETYNGLLDGKWDHMMDQTHLGYDGYWQQPMRNSLPMVRYIQTSRVSLAGHVGMGVEGSNATVQGDDKFHSNSGVELTVPPMDPYGPLTRYFDVFWRGTNSCEWNASPEVDWIVLSESTGTVGGENGTDTRVLISIDWDSVPEDFEEHTLYINVTTPCRASGFDKYAYPEPKVLVPVTKRSVPSDFTEGFVESDGHVSIEGPHYQKSTNSSSDEALSYHTFKNYGRTLGGVGLFPMGIEKLSLEEAPALDYELYLFSNSSAANVTLLISPSHNYLADADPLEYGIALFPAGQEPDAEDITLVQPVSGVVGTAMPDGWAYAVADSVWGLNSGNMTTSPFSVPQEGAYTLRIWCLLPGIVIQKIIVDMGGVRESYLGPPESFLVGRDELGAYNQTSFINTPDALGGVGNGFALRKTGGSSSNGGGDDDDDDDDDESVASRVGTGMVGVAALVAAAMCLR
ncbi:uncharacterized protein MKZ38_004681 [Zalerion maritima]|uniref:Gylcosyl hydrolase 115 C-terminal domain-containing protein n=1 Tax=Zalerion maritima TaxID=339359 RepID=A0AAD5RLL1_9PEZI|nr:uncharacterized protein MKZ38_004681 [Zalerion maritima]